MDTPDVKIRHVIPLDDLREHFAQVECWCHPFCECTAIVIHHAADCRERFERQDGEQHGSGWAIIEQPGVP